MNLASYPHPGDTGGTALSVSARLRANWLSIAQERGQSRREVERMVGAAPRPRGKKKAKRASQKNLKPLLLCVGCDDPQRVVRVDCLAGFREMIHSVLSAWIRRCVTIVVHCALSAWMMCWLRDAEL